jgi:hypothetical protein
MGSSPTQATNNNDPAWYARDPYLLRDAASYAFGYAYGKNYTLGYSTRPGYNTSGWIQPPVDIPGVMVLSMKPTLGYSDGPASALNTATNAFYAYVRHLNSGRKNYDPCDLMIYLTAIANIYSFIVWCERLYSCTLTYSEQNRYIPDALITAMGVSSTDIKSKLADFRMWLNSFINKVSCFVVPADITYFNKVVFMYRDLFIENGEGNIKDQIYMYNPDGFYRFNRDQDNRGILEYAPFIEYNRNKTVSDIENFGVSLLQNLAGDEDASLMSGDIFKVYGDKVIRLSSIDEFLALPLVYDPMVLWQIRNTHVCPVIRKALSDSATTTSGARTNISGSTWKFNSSDNQECYPGSVWQDNNGNLISVERYVNNSTAADQYDLDTEVKAYLSVNKMLCSDVAHPSPELVMESSRNMIGNEFAPDIDGANFSNTNFGWIDCGSYLCQNFRVVHLKNNTIVDYNTGVFKTGALTISKDMELLSKFAYRPFEYYVLLDQQGAVNHLGIVNDINNYIILDDQSVHKLHDVALLSLLYVPGVAKVN